jgi:hypothetical protein
MKIKNAIKRTNLKTKDIIIIESKDDLKTKYDIQGWKLCLSNSDEVHVVGNFSYEIIPIVVSW